jgi:hypothetical protein
MPVFVTMGVGTVGMVTVLAVFLLLEVGERLISSVAGEGSVFLTSVFL